MNKQDFLFSHLKVIGGY